MRLRKKLLIAIALVLLIVGSYLAGSHIQAQKYHDSRIQRCSTLISFAINKVETGDLTDPDMMEALISNVYAAYQYCDNSIAANQLHDLWNFLIFEEDHTTTKEIAQTELNDILRTIKAGN